MFSVWKGDMALATILSHSIMCKFLHLVHIASLTTGLFLQNYKILLALTCWNAWQNMKLSHINAVVLCSLNKYSKGSVTSVYQYKMPLPKAYLCMLPMTDYISSSQKFSSFLSKKPWNWNYYEQPCVKYGLVFIQNKLMSRLIIKQLTFQVAEPLDTCWCSNITY